MRVSVQSGLLRLYPLDLALEQICAAGYDGVELWGGQPHGYVPDLLREGNGDHEVDGDLAAAIAAHCARHHLELVCYTPEQVLYPSTAWSEKPTRSMARVCAAARNGSSS